MHRVHEILEEQKKRHHEHHKKLRLRSFIIFIVVSIFLLLFVLYMEQALVKLSQTAERQDMKMQNMQENY